MVARSRRQPPQRFSSFSILTVVLVSIPPSLLAAEKPAKSDGHPVVAGFERFHAEGSDAVKGGRLLLGELNCLSCHKAEAGLRRKQAPILDRVGERVRRSYFRKYLRDPQSVKPGSTMPNVLAGLAEAERESTIEALTHFLASTAALKRQRAENKSIAPGKQLYHQVGCVACHGSRDNAGKADKRLATSVPLGDLTAKYSLGGLAGFLENPHGVRPSGRMPGLLTKQESRQVANYLLQAWTFQNLAANVSYSYYEGTWDKLPNFTALKPKATGRASGFDLDVAQGKNNFALRFEGYLHLPRDGEYRFHLTSDDGSNLLLDGKQAAINDGIHPPSTVSQAMKLSKGTHKLSASIFNAGGGVELRVDIEGPGLGRQDVAPLLTLKPEGNLKPAAKPVDPKEDDDFPIKPELAAKGSKLFASIGCAQCHQLANVRPTIAVVPPLRKLHPDAGCLAAQPGKDVPHYALNPAQRHALGAALKASAPPAKATPAETVAATLTAFNCYACHERDKIGGIEQGFNSFFITTQPEMGEEGRVPPALTGVGAKLRQDYLKNIFNQGSRDRPYMRTHMPRFGEGNLPGLAEAFEELGKNAVPSVAAVKFTQPAKRVKAAARQMAGGNSLGCVKCHTFAGRKAEGVQGIDMVLMTKRLKHDWFYRYLLDPQKLRPGTRMPTAWSNGVTVLPDLLGGSTAQQIESIWVYLQDGNKAALPVGLSKHFIPLEPDKEAIIYRNFLQGAGTRAIGVGYPEKAHLAFDANDLRLALLWQGAFLDAARHWTDRGSGFEGPLGDDVLRLPSGVAFAVLSKDDEAWPTKSGRELGYKFRGYRTTADQRPTFFYTCHGVRIEDFPNAVAGASSPSLRRTLTLTADKPPAGLWFRAAVADKIEPAGKKGTYRINGEWTLKIESAAEAKIRKSGGKWELLVPVRFQDGKARIDEEFRW